MSLPAAKKTAWKWCSLYIRLRDAAYGGYVKCVTCTTWKHYLNIQAGHYYPKGAGVGRYIEFDVDNIASQCISCNSYKSGNLGEYQKYMVNRYGADIFDTLQQRNAINRMKILKESDYRELADKFRELAKIEAKRVGVEL